MSVTFRQPSPVERLPEEILMSILDYHFDIRRLPPLVATDPSSTVPQLQLQHKLQMSLCRVSKNFRKSISRLLLQNGLLRVTCLVDPLLDFYYLSPTICLSDRTDMFQIPCPQVTIDLAQGLPEALPVRSIISVHMLPAVLQVAQLHHMAGLTVLPQLDTAFQPSGNMTIDISCNSPTEFRSLHKAKVAVSNTLPNSNKTKETAQSAQFGIAPWQQGEKLPRPPWDVAFQISRRYPLSADRKERQLGLQVLRYLLATMVVAINPWNTSKIEYPGFTKDVKMMTLISAILIDSLVVEPEMLQTFYGDTTPEIIREFHREICPCIYLPHGMESGARYGFTEGDETWLFIESATQFLHNILPYEKSLSMIRLQNFRRRNDNITLYAPEVKERCTVYLEALERYHNGGSSYCCLASDAPLLSCVPMGM